MILYVVILISLTIFLWIFLPTAWGAPYIPSDIRKINGVLKWLELKSDEVVVDLGAGDGRVIILASLLYGSKSIGVEIDSIRYILAKFLILLLGLKGKATVIKGDLYNFDLHNADVVMFYLLPESIQRLRPKLESQLRSGSKIVSFQFPIPSWISVFVDEEKKIFVYEIDDNRSTCL
ncbi:MAG: class I SAM-dependent methyltransferase [Nostoc sp. DedSLP03]|uniref:class I SAM-dependent methyltransferase n=1 Tax=Nostoc sp. DedSLP03 TaxID=3075400 RepID=UPI002AD2E1AE|nr:class I SAM-dependent methyltransferase [Nostoc sp. DedSLP03]MDZ7968528.1 class I SAM-dependent methyltransferase [Nostoc sp. DedSLP03]